MSTAKTQPTTSFGRGLYSGTSRFTQPQGTVPRGSNMIWLRRGALRTTDGSIIYSSLRGNGPAANQKPFRWIGRYAPTGQATKLYALQVGSGTIGLIDVTTVAYGAAVASFASTYTTPSFIQGQDALAIALGYDVVPQLWQNGAATAITNTTYSGQPIPLGATSLFFHGGFLFAWGTSASYNGDGINGPDTLMQSDLQNFNAWNPLNTTFVGKGDGQVPVGGGAFALSEAGIAATNQLVLFKTASTYVFLGFFPSWSLVDVSDGVGSVAVNSTQYIADVGLMRLSYRGFAVFDAQNDIVDQYTDPIREYLFGADEPGIIPVDWLNVGLSMAAQIDNPKMYLCAVPLVGGGGALTRIFAYDVALRTWATPIDLPTPIASLAYIPQNNITTRTFFGGFSDGTIQNYGNNSSRSWNGTPISWAVRTPEVGAATTPSYIRRLSVRGQPIFGSQPSLTNAIVNYQDRNGLLKTKNLITPGATKVLTTSLDIDTTLLSANVDLTGTDLAIVEGLDYQYSPKPPSQIGGGLYSSISKVANVIYQQGATVSVPANSLGVNVLLPLNAPSANYLITIEPNWNTTTEVTGKTSTGFVVSFNTPAPADASGMFDWTAQIFS